MKRFILISAVFALLVIISRWEGSLSIPNGGPSFQMPAQANEVLRSTGKKPTTSPGPAREPADRSETAEGIEFPSLAEELAKADPDLCRLNGVNWEKLSMGTVTNLLSQPGSGLDENPVAQKFLQFLRAENPAAAAAALAGSADPGLRFLRALSLAGLMLGGAFGDTPSVVDLGQSQRLLALLGKEQPRNAAIPFFLAAVEQKAGAPDADIRAHFRQALDSPSFDLYMVSLWQELFLAIDRRPAYFYPAWEAMRTSPFPLFTAPTSQLKRVMENAPALAEKVEAFTEMLALETEEQRDYPESSFFDATAYGIGRGLLRQSFRLSGRDESRMPDWAQKRGLDELYSVGLRDLHKNTLLVSRESCRNELIVAYVRAVTEQIRDYRWRNQFVSR